MILSCIALLLLIIPGICSGLMDDIMFYDRFKGNWYWGRDAWTNKYLMGNKDLGAAFFGSTTFLSFLCDGWHLCKEIMVSSYCFYMAIMIMVLNHGHFFSWHMIATWFILRMLFYIGFIITFKLLPKWLKR